MNFDLKKNINLPQKLYKLSFILISFLIAFDPNGDWLLIDRIYRTGIPLAIINYDLGLFQKILFSILIISYSFIFIDLFLKKKIFFNKELIIIICLVIFSSLVGYFNGAEIVNIFIEGASFLFLPTQLIIFLNYKEIFNKNFFKLCYYIILITTLFKILIYLQLLGSISALFKPGALKLTSIYFCHGLGLIYTLLNKSYNSKGNRIAIILSLFIGILSIQRSYFVLIISILSYVFLKIFYSYKINVFAISFLILIPFLLINLDYRIDMKNLLMSTSNNVSIQKRYETLICFSQKDISDYLLGTGIGNEISCAQEGELDSDKYLRVNQTELELISLFLKAGLFNLLIYFYLFKNGSTKI